MNLPKIISERIGYANSILVVNGTNSILVDTGVKTNTQWFKFLLKEYNVSPKDIKLIVLTHTHYDHTGNLEKVAELTRAKVIVHKNEFENLKSGFTPIPIGQGKFSGLISKVGRKIWPTYASPKPFIADLINENEFDLAAFEIDGKIISTPGHTDGSQSILIGEKLIAGDTFLNMKTGGVFPPFANNPKTLLKTWEKLFSMNIVDIYPGHGPRFKIEKAYPDFEKWSSRLSIIPD